MATEIQHVFGIGFRCNVPDFLKRYGLRNTASPFDWMFVDFETAIKHIKTEFVGFLKNQLYMHHASHTFEIVRVDTPSFIPPAVAKRIHTVPAKFQNLLRAPFLYFSQDYSDAKLMLTMPDCYADDGAQLSNNLYEWPHMCVFNYVHHDFSNPDTLATLERRVDRMNSVIRDESEKTLLVHITRIESRFSSIEDAVAYYSEVYTDGVLRTYLAVIVCSDCLPDSYVRKGRLLVIFKHVPSYSIQVRSSAADNEFNLLHTREYFEKEYNILRSEFTFVLSGRGDD